MILALPMVLLGCTKTDVEDELNQQREGEELLTDEESEIIVNEDQEFHEDYMKELSDATEEAKMDEDIALIDELEGSKDSKKQGKAKGRCADIDENSVCIEFYGSFWSEQEMRLTCADAGTFSFDPCPSDMYGGCNTGLGTIADMVSWMYLRGGGDMTPESMKYAKMACDATLASEWIQMK